MAAPIVRQRLSDILVGRIDDHIIEKRLSPGDRLPTEHVLAAQFGVSRLAVREATKAFGFLGVIESSPGRGLTVGTMGLQKVVPLLRIHPGSRNITPEELTATRIVNESGPLPFVMKRMTAEPSIYTRLSAINEEVRTAKALDQWILHDIRFHNTLLQESGLRTLVAFSDLLQQFFQRFRTDVGQADWKSGAERHLRIINFLRDGNLLTAGEELRSHISSHTENQAPPEHGPRRPGRIPSPRLTPLSHGREPAGSAAAASYDRPFMSSATETRIGFVGVGRMGANMARRLKDVSYRVTAVYDSMPEVANKLALEIGALAAPSLRAVTEAADVIVTVVSDDAAQMAVFDAQGDNLLIHPAGKIFINCATLTPDVHVKLDILARAAGARTLEACMASSVTQARNGTLYLMCSGDRSAFDSVQPILSSMSDSGRHLKYVGAVGQASRLKALVNMVMNINTAGLAEGLGLASALGLDLAVVMEVFSQTGANSRVIATDGEDMINRDHACFFSAAHAAKDSGIAVALGRDSGLKLPMAEAAFGQYSRMVGLGLGDLDKSGIAELTFKGRLKAVVRSA